MRRWLSLVAASMALVSPAAAHAATRHAVPSGGVASDPCSEAVPCTLAFAVSGVANGDRVALAAGDYALSATLNVGASISLDGPFGASRARLVYSGPATANAVFINAANSALRRVDVVGTTNGSDYLVAVNGGVPGVVIEEVDLLNSGTAAALVASDVTVRDSRIVGMTSLGVAAVLSGTAVGCTIIADQGIASRALLVSTFFDSTASLVVRNTIVRGGNIDLQVEDVDEIGPKSAAVDVAFSAFDPGQVVATNAFGQVVLGSGNVDASGTMLVNAAAGADIHQLAGSNTVNAGSLAATQSTDLDYEGDPRVISGIPDIGADEYVPPPDVVTTAATDVSQTTATINAQITPNGRETSYRFDFGETAAYGITTTTGSAGNATTPQSGFATLTGLAPNTTYHYRVTATNSTGTTVGADVAFTTLAPPASPPAPSPPALTPQTPADTRPPVVGALKVVPARVRRGRPASLRFALLEAGRVTIVVHRLDVGRRRGKRCVVRARTGRRCVRAARVYAKALARRRGRVVVRIPARRIARKGRYRVTVIVVDAARNRSRPRTRIFTVR